MDKWNNKGVIVEKLREIQDNIKRISEELIKDSKEKVQASAKLKEFAHGSDEKFKDIVKQGMLPWNERK